MTPCNALFLRATVRDRQRGGLRQNGFTLIELMIVVVVIAILAAIAFPSYEQYVIRAKRSAAQAEMMNIANRQQQFFLANRVYALNLTELGYTIPADLSGDYDPDLIANNAATPPDFVITFEATGRQGKDGDLTLNSRGVKTPAAKW